MSKGNTVWSIYVPKRGRGAGVGGEEFYYLDDEDLNDHGLRKYIGQYIYPFIPTLITYHTLHSQLMIGKRYGEKNTY